MTSLPPEDPHVIVFADGCASWSTYRRRHNAEAGLAAAQERSPERWGGAQIVRYRRTGGGALVDPDSGEQLRSWRDCGAHEQPVPSVDRGLDAA